MNQDPLISVVIPAHNSEKTIGTAIKSIIGQTYKNIEIIVVDDNSTDNTGTIVKKYHTVKYYPLPFDDPNRINKRGRNINAGYSARNYGVEQSHGEWVTFQDADDASLVNRIEVQLKLAKEYNSSHVCIQWQKLKEEYAGKKLDVEKIFQEQKNIVIPTDEILRIAKRAKGPVIPLLGKINNLIPFEWKRLRIINKLFFGSLAPYPGSGNCPLVKREVFDRVKFNPLNKRVFPSFMGRGADRDFNFRVAETFKNSVCFKLPIYLWRSGRENPEFVGYEKYII